MKQRFPIEYPSFYEYDDVPCILYRTEDGHVRAVNDLGNAVDGAEVAYEATPITREQFERLSRARAEQYGTGDKYAETLKQYAS